MRLFLILDLNEFDMFICARTMCNICCFVVAECFGGHVFVVISLPIDLQGGVYVPVVLFEWMQCGVYIYIYSAGVLFA